MPANEDRSRVWALDHFLSKGLGGKLSRDASMTIQALAQRSRTMNGGFAPILTCGSILERVCWIGLGQWLGYFQQGLRPLSPQENSFLRGNSYVLQQNQWRLDISRLLPLLSGQKSDTSTLYAAADIIKESRELWPVFQGSHIISESLTDGSINVFFRFLHEGDVEDFNRERPSPDSVLDSLRTDHFDATAANRSDSREAVIAGFIRYTEFLSAMDGLFPGVEKGDNLIRSETTPEYLEYDPEVDKIRHEEQLRVEAQSYDKRRNREALRSEITDIIKWRIPHSARAWTAYEAVQTAFEEMVSEQFRNYPMTGLYWQSRKTHDELVRLSARFFAVRKQKPRKVRRPPPITNVVLLILENQSFDHMLGGMPGVDGASPGNVNIDPFGNFFHQHETTTRQMEYEPRHDFDNVAKQLKDNNSGFVKDFCEAYPAASAADRQEIMNYYRFGFLPAVHQLARDFTVCDRWFSSIPGPTWPNRFFSLTGTSSGKVMLPGNIADKKLDGNFDQWQHTVFDRLNEANISWKVYYHDFPTSLLLKHQLRSESLAQYRHIEDFYVDLEGPNQLPSFSLIEPRYFGRDRNDGHPLHNVMKAEKLVADVYNELRSSPHWESTLLVIYSANHGGLYDHVVPPAAIAPDDKTKTNGKGEYDFNQLGVRVPAIIVSPWVGRRIDSTTFDHTSVLRFLQEIWNLGWLGARTGAANSLSPLFTESEPRQDTVPIIRVPYEELVPDHPEWERKDSGPYNAAASFIYDLESRGTVLPTAPPTLERSPAPRVQQEGNVGEALARAGNNPINYREDLDERTQALLNKVESLLRGSNIRA